MELHEQLRVLADRFGRQVFDDADEFRGALDDFMLEGETSVGDTNLLVDAVRLGAYQRMNVLMDRGVPTGAALEAAGQRLAQDRGTVDIQSGCWACAVLGYAAGTVEASEVVRYRTAEAGPAPSEGQPTGTGAPPTVGAPSTYSPSQTGQQHERSPAPGPDPASGPDPAPGPDPASRPGDDGRSGESGGNKVASSRSRLVLLAVAGVFALLVVSAVARSLLTPSATPSHNSDTGAPAGPPGPSANDLTATLELAPDFDPTLESPVYMMPDSGTQLQDLPRGPRNPAFGGVGNASYVRWYESHGGAPLGHQTVRLVLTGHGDAPVIISQIQPFVIKRLPPLRGWTIFSGLVGTSSDIRSVQASLDCPEHPATLTAKTGQTTTSIDLQVSRSDVEVLEVTVHSSKWYVRWGLAVTYVSHGQVGTVRVTDPQLRVTGEALGTMRNYTYFSSLARAPDLDATPGSLRSDSRSASWLCR